MIQKKFSLAAFELDGDLICELQEFGREFTRVFEEMPTVPCVIPANNERIAKALAGLLDNSRDLVSLIYSAIADDYVRDLCKAVNVESDVEKSTTDLPPTSSATATDDSVIQVA